MTDSDRRLHVVAFDNPWPPDYGGAIDMFFKLKHLAREGIIITLHAFIYGRKPDKALEEICGRIFYYPRKLRPNPFTLLPYIVSSRNHSSLLGNLLLDDAPILFEGLHTCYLLGHPALKGRKKLVRMHNIESDYYKQAGMLEKRKLRRSYFRAESSRLAKFEKVLENASSIIAISENDYHVLKSRFPQTEYTGPFHSNEEVTSLPGMGQYALYHAKLSVVENDRSARWLAGEVFSKTDYPLIIAGHLPSSGLKRIAGRYGNITIMENTTCEETAGLIKEAHINILPAFQSTGIKLKLINSLYSGRFILTNSMMARGTGCEGLCEIAETADGFLEKIEYLRNRRFESDEIEKRSAVLTGSFDNRVQARKIIQLAGI